MSKTHVLKTIEPYYNDIVSGIKSFEIRKDDRDFEVGDVLSLQQYLNGEYTDLYVHKKIIYILRDADEFGLMPGYCILGIK